VEKIIPQKNHIISEFQLFVDLKSIFDGQIFSNYLCSVNTHIQHVNQEK